MKHLFSALLIVGMLSGCVVRTRPGHHNEPRRSNCGPAHHWDGNQCVQNGRSRDHRR